MPIITLREQDEARRLRKISTVSKALKAQRLDEQRAHEIIVEALDPEKMKQAISVLKKLQSIDFGGMKYFKSAVSAAMNDVNSELGGGASATSFTSQLSKIVAAGKKMLTTDPIVKALAFAGMIETAFKQAAQLIQSNIPQDTIKSMPKDQLMDTRVDHLLGDSANNVHAAVTKAFQPPGIFARLGGQVKTAYIKDPSDAADAIGDAKLSDVIRVVQSLRQGPQASDFADEFGSEVKSQLGAQGGAGGGRTAKPNAQAGADDMEELVSKIAGNTDVDAKSVAKVIDQLIKRGVIKK